ncbi:MAG: FtsX-like permease family protein, partial [Treponemataceae bacterium]
GVEKTPKGKVVGIIRDDAAILAALKDAGIDASYAAKRSAAQVTLVFAGKKVTQNVYGADLERERYLRERLLFKQGSWDKMTDPRALILSEGVVKTLKVEIGDRILVQLKTITGQNNVGEFVLAGVSQDMGLFSAMLAYSHRAYLNELLNIGTTDYQLFGILVPDLAKAETTSVKLQGALKKNAPIFELTAKDLAAAASGGMMDSRYQKLLKQAKNETWQGAKYRVFTINDMISQIEELVKVLNMVSTGILAVLFIIIMVGISNTFRMIMYERIKEIGTMRAIGTQRSEVRALFLYEAGFLAIAGTVAGWIFAGLVMGVLSLFNFGTDTFFALLMRNGHLSFAMQALPTLLNFLLVLILTLLAAFLPARKASRLEPAAALRTSK